MRQMMFDVMHTTAEMLGRKAFLNNSANSFACAAVLQPVDDETEYLDVALRHRQAF